ncbi:MAG: preprotein translocase subunit SecG [Candidatus Gastranaerophilales bacterium]|nr:preprotein translocase subunit SecG [Candidatus Gastranaerophilales bacterium]
MLTFVWIIQIISAVLLILLVLLHSPKGDGLGAIGGAANLFTSQKSAEKGLNHVTYVLSGIFMVCSFITGFHLFT